MKHFHSSAVKRLAVLIVAAVLLMPTISTSTYSVTVDDDMDKVMVSMGDSFSSGEGIPPFYDSELPVALKTESEDWLAHRSQKSWPGNLILYLPSENAWTPMKDRKDENWFFVASSGAETKHLSQPQAKLYNVDGYSFPFALIPPQLDIFEQLKREGRQVDYVTLTLGGNDAGFSDIIATCVFGSADVELAEQYGDTRVGSFLKFGALQNHINWLWENFYKDDGIGTRLIDAYEKIENAAPDARILVAGYPKLFDPQGGLMISPQEAGMVNKLVTQFNTAVSHLIQNLREDGMKIEFISVEDIFEGHEIFSDIETTYFNGFVLLPGVKNTDDLDNSLSNLLSAYSVHPNAGGALAYATCVQEVIEEYEHSGQSETSQSEAPWTEVPLEEIPDQDGFMARLENISNSRNSPREYHCRDTSQYADAVQWLLEPTKGILVWSSCETYLRPETFMGQEAPSDPLLAEEFYHLSEYGPPSYYYAKFNGDDVDWALENILNMAPRGNEGVITDGIVYKGGSYYVNWGDVGYLSPAIKVTSISTNGINYNVTFQWQDFYPWDDSLAGTTHYAILRQNDTDRGPVWSIVQTSANPIF